MDRRAFLASAAATIVSPLAAAVVTTRTVVTNAAWTDLGAGPMLLSFKGDGVYAIGDAAPSLTDGGFTIRKGDSLPLKTTSHVWARSNTGSGVSVYVSSINGGGGGPTSVWSAADAAANGMTLSNGGLTVVNPVVASGWRSLRSSAAKTSGKLYVEFVVDGSTVTAASQMVGLASSGFNISSYLGNSVYSCAFWASNNFVSAGFTSNYDLGANFGANYVIGLAIDFAAGSIWLASNGVWDNGSNPATGLLPIASFTPATVGALFAAMSFGVGAVNGNWTLQPTAASQKYAPPAGFTPWG